MKFLSQENVLDTLVYTGNIQYHPDFGWNFAEIQLSVILKYTWTLLISIKWSNFFLLKPLSTGEFT